MSDQDVLDRLDDIIALLNLAFAEPIGKAREAILKDKTNAAILEALAVGPLASSDLMEKVKLASGQAERTIQMRLLSLAAQHAIEKLGTTGKTVSYRAAGLFGGRNRRPTNRSDSG